MNGIDLIFLVQFIIVICILLVKLYNVLSGLSNLKKENTDKKYNMQWAFILFIAYFISYFIGFVTYMQRVEELAYLAMFNLETGFILLNVLFFIIEILMYVSLVARETTSIKLPYFANKARK